jgi:hypothetical protein
VSNRGSQHFTFTGVGGAGAGGGSRLSESGGRPSSLGLGIAGAAVVGRSGGSMQEGDDFLGGAGAGTRAGGASSSSFSASPEHPAQTSMSMSQRSQLVYVGDPDYRNLSVLENMDLYMKEQVFNVQRPSGASPYMKCASGSLASSSNSSAKDSSFELPQCTFIKTSNRDEKFIAAFCEKVIDISDAASRSGGGSSNSPSGGRGNSSSSSAAASGVGGGGGGGSVTAPATPPRVSKSRRDQLPSAEEEASAAREETRYIVLSDTSVYFVQAEFATTATFSDAPVPTVLRSHSIYTLQ